MPLIPQFRAEGPASRPRPTMETEGAPRVDASEAVRGLARLSGAIQGGGTQLPQVDPNLGQGQAAGMEAIGEGVQDVGSALLDIEQRVQTAKNYADEHAAQIAMDREVLEFEKWRQDHPDPTEWEPGWQERMSQFSSRYFADKNLSPAAETKIRQRMESFTSRTGVRVGMDAMRETVGQAASALMADVERADEAGDLETGLEKIDEGVRQGWIAEDEAERRKIQLRESIEAKTLQAGMNRVNTFLLNGDPEGAKEELMALPMREDERALQLAEVDRKHAVNIKVNELNDLTYEEPHEAIKRLEAIGEDGKPLNDPEIRGENRAKLLKQAYAIHHEEREAVLSETVAGIDGGSISTAGELEFAISGMEVTEDEKAALLARMQGERIANAKQIRELQTSVSAYDPKSDPYGVKAQAIRELVILSVPDSDRKKMILEELGKREAGEPMSMTAAAKEKAKKRYYDQLEAAGKWKVDAGNVEEIELEDGRKAFLDTSADVKPGDPDYFDNERMFGFRKIGRLIRLSPEDAVKVGEDGAIIEDLNRMDEIYEKADQNFERLEIEEQAGEIQNYDEWNEKAKELTREEREENARRLIELERSGGKANSLPGRGGAVSSGLFPSSANLEEEANSLLDATGH